jgi:hypothetical protein
MADDPRCAMPPDRQLLLRTLIFPAPFNLLSTFIPPGSSRVSAPVVLIIDVGFLSLDGFGLGVPGVFFMFEFSFLVISFLLFFSVLLNGPDLFGSLRRVIDNIIGLRLLGRWLLGDMDNPFIIGPGVKPIGIRAMHPETHNQQDSYKYFKNHHFTSQGEIFPQTL